MLVSLLSVCMCVCVCLCVHGPISHHNFVECGLIVPKLYVEISGYNTDIVKKYHGNRSKVKVTKFAENT